jgi:single-strand DNA-binding protein
MNDMATTVGANLVEDPELRFTTCGQPVANLRLASTERRYDRQTGQWTDGPTTYLRGTVWGAPAQNVAESLHKGDRVVVVGRLRQRDYETRDGEKRSTHELDIDEIGASLRYATADLHKATRNGTVTNNQPDDQPPI